MPWVVPVLTPARPSGACGAGEPSHPLAARMESRLSGTFRFVYWIVLFQALLWAYAPAWPGPFVFDDIVAIVQNDDFRHPHEWWRVFRSHSTSIEFDRRPVPGLATLVNFQYSGLNPSGYRAINLLIHWFCAILLAESIALGAKRLSFPFGRLFGLSVATLWVVHPLNSIVVAYVFQRMESMMSLFIFGAIYAVLRAASSQRHQRSWLGVAWVSSAFTMLCKETGAVTPFVLLVAERVLVFPSWRDLFRSRRWFYIAHAASLITIIPWLLSGVRIGEMDDIPELAHPWSYFKTQCRVIVNYLKLVLWPAPLIFYPMPRAARALTDWMPYALLLCAIFGSVALAARQWRWLWAPLAGFLFVLGATSSFLPVPLEPAIDFRMHFPSACALIVLLAAAGFLLRSWKHAAVTLAVCLPLWAVLLLAATRDRAADYRSAVVLWIDVVSKEPDNMSAWANLAGSAYDAGDLGTSAAAAAQLTVLADHFKVPSMKGVAAQHLGRVWLRQREFQKAADAFTLARELEPHLSDLHIDEIHALVLQEQWQQALEELQTLPEPASRNPFALSLRAEALSRLGRTQEAEAILSALPDWAHRHTEVQHVLRRIRDAAATPP